jgi:hypothetical protein
MAQLTFGLPKGELRLAVLIGHDYNYQAALRTAGHALPRPAWTAGVIDTDSSVTCVTPAVLRTLGLTLAGQATSHTAAGQITVNLAEVSLSIPPPPNAQGPMLTRANKLEMELPSPIPGVEVLIGRTSSLTANGCSTAQPGSLRWNPNCSRCGR